jgi:hypothetical protein
MNSGGYYGDIAQNQTVDFKFETLNTSQVPTTFAGSPALSVYKSNGTTETTTGVTLTVDFDGRTGLHHVRIVTTNVFYATANDYQVVVTAGTVNSVSWVGRVLREFSIQNRYPSPAAIVTAVEAGAVLTDIADRVNDLEGTLSELKARRGTAQAGGASTITLDATASATNDLYNGSYLSIVGGTGAGQSRYIIDYVGSSKLATVDTAWITNPDATSIFVIH